MDEIQVGDVVQLVSGSPKMTVFRISKGRAAVVWSHFATGIIREQRIPLRALVKQTPYVKNKNRSFNERVYEHWADEHV